MYLEEVIIDGFKSYATRITVGPFHPQFNAVCGLNGTGKSNVLDSICFVMGIKALQHMRVSNLEELIYKQGQAGVTKANVTLVFRNPDRSKSPVGLADHTTFTITRQIAVGGRDRYLLNGHVARASDVDLIFQSVQLNINNPHFLVMQGRITKVINMKPIEVLAMIGEAAGTQIYETKRRDSMKTMALKEAKLSEIENLIETEINPMMASLKQDQENHSKLVQLSDELIKVERDARLADYHRVLTGLKSLASQQQSKKQLAHETQEFLNSAKANVMELQAEISQSENSAAEQGRTEHLKKITEGCRSLENKLAVEQVALQEALGQQEAHKKAIDALERKVRKILDEKASLVAGAEKEISLEDSKKATLDELTLQLSRAMDTLEELKTGHLAGATQGGPNMEVTQQAARPRQTLRQQLVAAEVKLKELLAEEAKLELVIRGLQVDVETLQRSTGEVSETLQQLRDNLKVKLAARDSLEANIQSLESSLQQLPAWENRRQEIRERLGHLEETESQLRRKLYLLTKFEQENPQLPPGVYGLALQLMRIKHEDTCFATALEEAGKSRLFNVVVATDESAKKLIEYYKNIRRITCIPINRIRSNPVSDETLRKAKQLNSLDATSNDVKRPLDTIEVVDPRYLESMDFVFGHTLLCKDVATAEVVSQHSSIKCPAVTIAGDYYNPAGSIAGGSTAGLGGVLLAYRSLLSVRLETEVLERERRQLQEKLEEARKASSTRANLNQILMTQNTVEVSAAQKRLDEYLRSSTEGVQQRKVEELKAAEQQLVDLRQTKIPQLRDVEIPRIQNGLATTKHSRDDQIAQLEQQVTELKKQQKAADSALQTARGATSRVKRNIEVLGERAKAAEEEVTRKREELTAAEADVAEKSTTVQTLSEALQREKRSLQAEEDRLATASADHRCRLEALRAAEQLVADTEASLADYSHQVRCFKQQIFDLERRRTYLERDYRWLVTEYALAERSAREGTINPFKEPAAYAEQLEELRRGVGQLQKSSRNVSSVLHTAEGELQELLDKKAQLNRDKQKLVEFIEELDVQKRQALEDCWKQVDTNFCNIMSCLLPSCEARLTLANPENFDDGLEMQVSLNGSRKLSLGELSGGQRSLLSLSLVLALLKYRPAPIYILDEVDAALDLSHTQRIGQMLKSQFRESQFIVVSLKENLFNYADVLFRTSFVGGSSTVTRTENHGQVEKEDTSRQPTTSSRSVGSVRADPTDPHRSRNTRGRK